MTAQLGVGHLIFHQVRESGRGVDAHGMELVGRSNAESGGGGGADGGRRGAKIRHAEGVGQAGRGIDGAHKGSQSGARADHTERGGCGGLAHPAWAYAHQGLLAGEPPFHRLTRTTSAVTLSDAPAALAASTRS